jgi:hypothetical protein
MSYAIGLIGRETRGALEIVRRVRNFFAHHTSHAKFDSPEVVAECRKIRAPKNLRNFSHLTPILTDRNPPKLNYVHCCSFICVDIYNHLLLKDTKDSARCPIPIEIF